MLYDDVTILFHHALFAHWKFSNIIHVLSGSVTVAPRTVQRCCVVMPKFTLRCVADAATNLLSFVAWWGGVNWIGDSRQQSVKSAARSVSHSVIRRQHSSIVTNPIITPSTRRKFCWVGDVNRTLAAGNVDEMRAWLAFSAKRSAYHLCASRVLRIT